MENFIRYVGYADTPTKEQSQQHPVWDVMENTQEAIKGPLSQGYTAIGTTSFSHEIKEKGPEPIRKGDFVVDIVFCGFSIRCPAYMSYGTCHRFMEFRLDFLFKIFQFSGSLFCRKNIVVYKIHT